jgi:AraC-like DNA-binding protein
MVCISIRVAPGGCMDLIRDDVVGSLGYSERQLRRRVLAATGHGPKRLMRIARMQGVLR